MLGRFNLSSLNSNAQHLVTTLSGHSSSCVSDALRIQPTQVTYSQQDHGLAVSIGSRQPSSFPVQHAVQLRGQAYLSQGWAASHLQYAAAQQSTSSDDNFPLLELVSSNVNLIHLQYI